MTRARPTKATQAAVLARQGDRCNACGRPFDACGLPVEWDHWHARGLGGPDDAHDPAVWQALGRPCHLNKTRRDLSMIAKAKRLARKLSGDWPKRGRKLRSGAKLTGRGFDKRWKQPMRGRAYLKPQPHEDRHGQNPE